MTATTRPGPRDEPPGPPSGVRERVLEAARAERSATRRESVLRTALVIAAALSASVAVFALRGGLRAEPRGGTLIVLTAGGSALLAAVIAAIALGRGRSMLGRPRAWLIVPVLAAPFALLAWKIAVSSRFPGMCVAWDGRPGFRCLWLSLAMAGAPLAALLLLRRRTDPVHPALSGAALGCAAAACSWVLVDMWCPVAHVEHLLLGHVLPLVLVTALGALAGRLVLGVRARR
jgi:hypothetical protein